ncbi:hypothetical protein POM88_051347 [Heracleum sosnowskyi]|uniref:Uncharacterized protein n=1 Tax=Heracleum sosnowskyi TaxID=360622 RepID=A0AAD8H234_9APIA|nr:hypothetical protein POM88_051347 [Heracleum sosnowskyi]
MSRAEKTQILERERCCALSHPLLGETSNMLYFPICNSSEVYLPTYLESEDIDNLDEDIDKSELIAQLIVFQGLCSVLYSLYQEGLTKVLMLLMVNCWLLLQQLKRFKTLYGPLYPSFPRTLYCATSSGPCLICFSNFNIETLKQTSFECYHILLPSDKGLMLLREIKRLKNLYEPLYSRWKQETAILSCRYLSLFWGHFVISGCWIILGTTYYCDSISETHYIRC